jgi:four helix bundle protein
MRIRMPMPMLMLMPLQLPIPLPLGWLCQGLGTRRIVSCRVLLYVAHEPRHHQMATVRAVPFHGSRGGVTVPAPLVGMTRQHRILRFGAFSLSLSVIHLLRPLMDTVRTADRSLEKQLRSAASSVSLNVAESRGRTGGDRLHFLRIALGSAEEVTGCLFVAQAWGYLSEEQTAECLDKLAHLSAVLGKLTRT